MRTISFRGSCIATRVRSVSPTPDVYTSSYILSDRGELLSELNCQTNCSTNDYAQSANGVLVDPAGHAQKTNAAQSWYTLSGATITNAALVAPHLGGGTNTYAYDSSGRQITDTLTPPQGAPSPGPTSYPRTYDAENHLVYAPTGPACNPNNTSVSCYADATLTWGPEGQLRLIAQKDPTAQGWPPTQNADLHWDGNTLLFSTIKQSGASAQTVLYIGKAATTGGDGGLIVADRDQNGIEEAWHTNSSYSAWNNSNFSLVGGGRFGVSGGIGINWGSCWSANDNYPCAPAYMPPTAPDGLLVGFSRADGYSFGTYAIQGVRVYDSTSQQWLTPDAYAGDVHDPMSQKPFVWTGNNPLQYTDPSGYVVDWKNMDPYVRRSLIDLMASSHAFNDEMGTMELDANTYHFVTLSSLGPGNGSISVSGSDVTMAASAADRGADLQADFAHEGAHGADYATGLFGRLDHGLGWGRTRRAATKPTRLPKLMAF